MTNNTVPTNYTWKRLVCNFLLLYDIMMYLMFIFVLVIVLMLAMDNKEGFGEGTYLWYRDPYSIKLWYDTVRRHAWWDLFHRRKYRTINQTMYVPTYRPYEF